MKNAVFSLQMALQALLIHRFRTLLSTLGIVFGVASLVAMLAIGEGAKKKMIDEISILGVQNILIRSLKENEKEGDKKRPLTMASLYRLKGVLNDFATLSPLVISYAKLGMDQKALLGVTPDFLTALQLQPQVGRLLTPLDLKRKEQVVIAGSHLLKTEGVHLEVGKSLLLKGQHYRLVGILKEKAKKNSPLTNFSVDDALFIPLSNFPEDVTLDEIFLHVHLAERVVPVANLVSRLLKSDFAVEIIVPKELIKQKTEASDRFNILLGSLSAVSLLVGGIGIVNALLASVYERMREIGLYRVLGATRKEVGLQFLLEALLISLVGALIGLVCGIAFSFLMTLYAEWEFVVTISAVMLSITFALIVGAIAGCYPAYVACRLDPVQVLRKSF